MGQGSRWDLEMQVRKASQRDWFVLTCKETVGIPTGERRKQQKEGRTVLLMRVFVSDEGLTVRSRLSFLIETVAFKEFRSALWILNKTCLSSITDSTGRNYTHRTDALPPSALKRTLWWAFFSKSEDWRFKHFFFLKLLYTLILVMSEKSLKSSSSA